MKTIYKYPIVIDDVIRISLPGDAQILSIQEQNGQTCLWALLDPQAKKRTRTIRVFGTGHPFDLVNHQFISTVNYQEQNLVFHFFEELKHKGLGYVD